MKLGTTYMYSINTPMRECVDFDRDFINIGLHSLLSLRGVCDSRTKDMLFFPNGNLYPFITTNVLYNHVYVGKLGEIFTYNGKIYQVVKSDTCANCAFRENDCSIIRSRIGLCVSSIRFDKTNVVFKEIKMEIKNNQLTIDIPEGMEIDLENSDLAKGIVRFKQSTITYED